MNEEEKDTYFTKEYGRLYENIDNAKLISFEYSDKYGAIYYQFLKRKLPFLIDGIQYFDAMTPYGYGGPLITTINDNNKSELQKNFIISLNNFLKQENVICEFVRFHPGKNNAQFFSNYYTLRNCRKAVYTNCSSADPIRDEFNSDTARRIRKAIREGVSTVIIQKPSIENMRQFIECYYSNMKRINADDYFYFTEEYFTSMWNNLNNRLILVFAIKNGKIIGSDIGFSDNEVYTRHLSGITDEGNKYEAARVMAGAQVQWAKDHNYKYVFHGCGLTNSSNDSLLKFKSFFTKSSYREYWQGGRINNNYLYQKACSIANNYDDSCFFPAYRANK